MIDKVAQVYRVIHKSVWNFRTRLRNNQDRHSRKEHINRYRISPSFFRVLSTVDMLPFGVTIPATVPQILEIPEGLTNYPVHCSLNTLLSPIIIITQMLVIYIHSSAISAIILDKGA